MENEKREKTPIIVYITICIVICLSIVVVGYLAFKLFIEDDKNKVSKIKYDEIKYKVEDEKLYVNNTVSEVVSDTVTKYSILGQIDNVLVVSVNYTDYSGIYALDKDGKIVETIVSKDKNKLSGSNYYGSSYILNRSVMVTSNKLERNNIYSVCLLKDDDVVEYEERFDFSSGKFSNGILESSRTAKGYITYNNISCLAFKDFKDKEAINGNGTYTKTEINNNDIGIKTRINDDKKTVIVSIDWNNCKTCDSYVNNGKVMDYTVKFHRNVSKVELFHDNGLNKTIYYLMSDGTVEYTPLDDYFNNNDTTVTVMDSYGTIEGVSNIVEITFAKNKSIDGEITGSEVALMDDGSFYDLTKIINNK